MKDLLTAVILIVLFYLSSYWPIQVIVFILWLILENIAKIFNNQIKEKL